MERIRKSVIRNDNITWQPQPDQVHHLTPFTYYELHPDLVGKSAGVIFDILSNSTEERREVLKIKHLTEEK